jgi:hypothetical protein
MGEHYNSRSAVQHRVLTAQHFTHKEILNFLPNLGLSLFPSVSMLCATAHDGRVPDYFILARQ